jgi:hypothetical protein
MENALTGQSYFVTEFESIIDKKEWYSVYRATFLGKQKGINEFMIFTNKIWNCHSRIDKNIHVIPSGKITKMESLTDILTTRFLPNEMVVKIDEFL